MPKILFWNVQRLSASDLEGVKEKHDAKLDVIMSLIKEQLDIDYSMLCEVMAYYPGCSFAHQVGRKLQQLHYLCLDKNFKGVQLQRPTIQATETYMRAAFKGGNNFQLISKRAVMQIPGTVGSVNVFMYHANASKKAKKTMLFAVTAIREMLGKGKWMLIGDFNITPEELEDVFIWSDSENYIKNYQIYPSGIITHKKKELDYCIANFKVTVEAIADLGPSDHLPIVATW